MSDSRGQASTFLAGVLVLSVVLSVVVAGGVTQLGLTTDLNLNENANDGVPDVPSISYVAVCFLGEPPAEFDVDSVVITFSNEGESGEFFSTSFTSSELTPDFLIVKGGQRMERFELDGPVYSFGSGQLVDPAYPNNAPCGPGAFGVKQEEGGDKELVPGGNGPNGPIGPVLQPGVVRP